MGERRFENDSTAAMEAVHWKLDTDQNDPSIEVAEVIADLEDQEITDLPPIYETLDSIIENIFSEPPSPEAQTVLQFSYEGYRITLTQDGYATFLKVASD